MVGAGRSWFPFETGEEMMLDGDGSKITTLDQLETAGTGERPVVGAFGPNMGNKTITARFPVADMNRISVVANGDSESPAGEIAQRKLDMGHATKLATFILRGLVDAAVRRYVVRGAEIPPALMRIQEKLGSQPYFSLPPVIANLRGIGPRGQGLRAEPITDGERGEIVAVRFWMGQQHILYIIDGQHRRKAIELVMDFLEGDVQQRRHYSRKNLYGNEGLDLTPEELAAWSDVYHAARAEALITVEIHLGLDIAQERQLFHDTNNLGKKVEASLALLFDSANPVNHFIKDELITPGLIFVVDQDQSVRDWEDDSGEMSRKDLVAVNAHLFLNKSNIKGARPQDIQPRQYIAKRFWDAVSEIDGFGEPGARAKTVAAQPVVLKALAKLTYDFAFGRSAEGNDRFRDRLLDGIPSLDFSHDNPMWEYYRMTDVERTTNGLDGLAAYLPEGDGANRDIGGRDSEGRMRFGAKHNDIIPILGDMIRWKLQLPSRHGVRVG
jgi:hypothetical protein